jgi:hypothetical protein
VISMNEDRRLDTFFIKRASIDDQSIREGGEVDG